MYKEESVSIINEALSKVPDFLGAPHLLLIYQSDDKPGFPG